MEKKRKISIIGSTGSIGTQALEVIEKLQDKFEIIALAGGNNVELLIRQAEKFKPKYICCNKLANIPRENRGTPLAPCVRGQNNLVNGRELSDFGEWSYPNQIAQPFTPTTQILYGAEGLEQICSNRENDIILVACSGKIGLNPTLTAIENGIDIALANKETLVMAGDIVMQKAREKGVNIIPVDSEHCAIHQCIKDIRQVDKLIITASGGPFLHKSVGEMKSATVKEALAHPRWNMGKKITVDSATLMNKGLEIIEAHHLFGMNYDDIDVVIHPQSIVHSAIEYKDGSVIAQLGLPSMHIPIQYAITYPERFEGIKSKIFSFTDVARLDFEKPDYEKFPTVQLAYCAGRLGGTATACLNAANEEAVFAFLDGKIKLYQIYEITKQIFDTHKVIQNPTIDEIFAVDAEIRRKTKELID